jgi:hypothetical protein
MKKIRPYLTHIGMLLVGLLIGAGTHFASLSSSGSPLTEKDEAASYAGFHDSTHEGLGGKASSRSNGTNTNNHGREKPGNTLAAVRSMPTDAFAREMAALLKSEELTPDVLERKMALLRGMDAEKALATYTTYKNLFGLGHDQTDPKMVCLINWVGHLGGANLINEVITKQPSQIDIGAYVHGWAEEHPDQAVDWYNDLPGDSPIRKYSLHGLFFGLAQRSPEIATETFEAMKKNGNLQPAELSTMAESIFGSLFSFQSMDATKTFVSTLPEPLRITALEKNTWCFDRRPPSDLVPLLASYQGDSQVLAAQTQSNLSRWTAANPADALSWAGDYASENDDQANATRYFASVAKSVDPGLLQNWLKTHPQHPAATLARQLLQQ